MSFPKHDTTVPSDTIAYRVVRIRRIKNAGRKTAQMVVVTAEATLWIDFVAKRTAADDEFVAPTSVTTASGKSIRTWTMSEAFQAAILAEFRAFFARDEAA